MRNIMKDLAHYDAVIQSYLRITQVPLLNPTLAIIQDLRKVCLSQRQRETIMI